MEGSLQVSDSVIPHLGFEQLNGGAGAPWRTWVEVAQAGPRQVGRQTLNLPDIYRLQVKFNKNMSFDDAKLTCIQQPHNFVSEASSWGTIHRQG